MKYKHIVLAVLIAAASFFIGWFLKNLMDSGFKSFSKNEQNFNKDASYSIGMSIGSTMVQDGIIPDYNEFLKGVKDASSGGKTRFSEEEAINIINAAYTALMEKKEADFMAKGEEALQEGIDFLARNNKKTGVATTSSGLQYEIITETTGPKPAATDMVRVHYEGKLIDGTVFDSSLERGEPVEFPLDGVISGWTEGVQLMSVGSKYRFTIPSEMAYGERGGGPIPPNSVLIFEVELLDIIK